MSLLMEESCVLPGSANLCKCSSNFSPIDLLNHDVSSSSKCDIPLSNGTDNLLNSLKFINTGRMHD